MSKIKVDLENIKKETDASQKQAFVPEFGGYQQSKEAGKLKYLKIFGLIAGGFLLLSALAGFVYWQNLKTTPQYSLALLIDAARRDDQQAIDALVDTDAVVDDFMPQVVGKAIEMYGRGVPRETLLKVARIAQPLLPEVKRQAHALVPVLIREKTARFDNVPFWAIAFGAGRIMDITVDGDKAFVKSNLQNRPLELTMKKNGDRWQIVGVKDEELAQKIAEKIGQEIIAAATRQTDVDAKGKQLGVENLEELLEKAKDIFR